MDLGSGSFFLGFLCLRCRNGSRLLLLRLLLNGLLDLRGGGMFFFLGNILLMGSLAEGINSGGNLSVCLKVGGSLVLYGILGDGSLFLEGSDVGDILLLILYLDIFGDGSFSVVLRICKS